MSKLLRAIKQILRPNSTPETLVKLVGTDRFNNKFYERLPGNRHYNSTRRFYEPARYDHVRLHIDPAWEAWLRGTRKNPPSLEETVAQENKRQQLAERPTPMLPTSYGMQSPQGGTTSFPMRDQYELNPGSKPRDKDDSNATL